MDDPDLVDVLADQADLLYDEGRRDEADARCRELIERFAGEDDPRVVEMVAWAREAIAHGALQRGWDLHQRGWGPQAEAAYRAAIEGGCDAAWLYLGVLLQGAAGREAEEEGALRAAIRSDDPDVAARAALELGALLRHRGDSDGARAGLELAAGGGAPDAAWRAHGALAFLAARRRDRAELESRVRVLAAARDEDDVNVSGAAPLIVRLCGALVGGRLTRRPWARLDRYRWEAGRRRRARRIWS